MGPADQKLGHTSGLRQSGRGAPAAAQLLGEQDLAARGRKDPAPATILDTDVGQSKALVPAGRRPGASFKNAEAASVTLPFAVAMTVDQFPTRVARPAFRSPIIPDEYTECYHRPG